MGLDFYDLAVDIIGDLPPILEPVYWVGTIFLFIMVLWVFKALLTFSFNLLGR